MTKKEAKIPTQVGNSSYSVGYKKPPKNRQFGQPDGNIRKNGTVGSWSKKDSARYKLERMMEMSADELGKIVADNDAPLFEKKLAICIKDGKWAEISGMIDQVYGKPKQVTEVINIDPPKPLFDRVSNAENDDAGENTPTK